MRNKERGRRNEERGIRKYNQRLTTLGANGRSPLLTTLPKAFQPIGKLIS